MAATRPNAIVSACSTWWPTSFRSSATGTWLQQASSPNMSKIWSSDGRPRDWRWAEKIAKQNVIARDNSHYGIENRKYVTNVSKARELSSTELGRIADPYTAMSLRLQAAFGLRREESIKIRPEWANWGNILALKDTWTKGGRAREIPIRNDEQRQVLDDAKSLAGRGSLIPADRSYVDQLRRFEHQCAAAGVHRIHGHRHQYAQVRYRELTGWSAPAAGGPRSKDLSPEQREVDRQARLTVSLELGHGRAVIAEVYLSRQVQFAVLPAR